MQPHHARMVTLRSILQRLLLPAAHVLAPAGGNGMLSRQGDPPLSLAPADASSKTIVHALLHEAESREAAIARELHDGVGSSLAGVSLLLGTAQSFTREPEALALLHKAQEQVAALSQQVRQISRGMMPAGQVRGALLPALEHFAAGMNGLQGMRCTVKSRGNFSDVSPATGGHLFRTVQEATANALRHGGARSVRITLSRAGSCCRLTISDDGTGCSPEVLRMPGAGMGIQSMQARAKEIGGRLGILAAPRGGLKVQVTWSAGGAR